MLRIIFEENLELTPRSRRLVQFVTFFYVGLLIMICFLPQNSYSRDGELITPGIVQWGRIYFLPIPFNSLVNADQIDSWGDFRGILMQNVMNIFLLMPLVFCLLLLFPKWRSKSRVLRYSFLMSLGIESTQLFLDFLIDAKRVVELDDLWTNSLGGLLAYTFYQLLMTFLKCKQAPNR